MEIIIHTKRIPPVDGEFVFRKQTLKWDNYDILSQGIAEKSIRRNFRPVLPAGHAAAYKHTEPRF